MMFEYFPDNYPWSMALQMALNAGGVLSEIDDKLRSLKHLAGKNDDAANHAWHEAWSDLGKRNLRLAKDDAIAGHSVSAGQKYFRSAIYFLTAERMCKSGSNERLKTYRSMLETFTAGLEHSNSAARRVDIPFENTN